MLYSNSMCPWCRRQVAGQCLGLPAWVQASLLLEGHPLSMSGPAHWGQVSLGRLAGRALSRSFKAGKRNATPSHPIQAFTPMGRPLLPPGVRHAVPPCPRCSAFVLRWAQGHKVSASAVCQARHPCCHIGSLTILQGRCHGARFVDENVEAQRDLVTSEGTVEWRFEAQFA